VYIHLTWSLLVWLTRPFLYSPCSVYVWTPEGKKILDFTSGIGVTSTGYANQQACCFALRSDMSLLTLPADTIAPTVVTAWHCAATLPFNFQHAPLANFKILEPYNIFSLLLLSFPPPSPPSPYTHKVTRASPALTGIPMHPPTMYPHSRMHALALPCPHLLPPYATRHCHPRIVAAVQAQAAKISHAQVNIGYHPPMLELADALTEVTPDGLDSLFFCSASWHAPYGDMHTRSAYTHVQCPYNTNTHAHTRTHGGAPSRKHMACTTMLPLIRPLRRERQPSFSSPPPHIHIHTYPRPLAYTQAHSDTRTHTYTYPHAHIRLSTPPLPFQHKLQHLCARSVRPRLRQSPILRLYPSRPPLVCKMSFN